METETWQVGRMSDAYERERSEGRPGLVRRAWERLQFPAGPESRARYEEHRAQPRHGW